jgi:hypothetical protein
MENNMKVLLCGVCGDIRAFDEGVFTPCKCRRMAAKWVDASRGTVQVIAKNRDKARIIGMNNHMITAALSMPHTAMDYGASKWKQLHAEATQAPGYIFDDSIRGCWACIVKIGVTNDITWAPEQAVLDADPSKMESFVFGL